MKKYIILLIILVIVLGIGTWLLFGKSNTYINDQYGFSFVVPKDWTIIPSSKENPPLAWGGDTTYAVNLEKNNIAYFSIIVSTDKQILACKSYFTEETTCPLLQVIGKKGEYTFSETHNNGNVNQSIIDDFYKKILPSFKVSN